MLHKKHKLVKIVSYFMYFYNNAIHLPGYK